MSFLSNLMKIFLLLSIFVFYIKSPLPFVESITQNLETDKEALISFKSQISLESQNSLASWDQNTSPCNWTGVVCNVKGQIRVVGLHLSNMGLVGSVSPYIGNLSLLRSLQLQNNQLRGPIPAEICDLVRLRILNMSLNSLEDGIPLNISRLVELRDLDLMKNKISGKIPEQVSLIANLRVLNLGGNRLSGPIPPSIANLSSLTNLNFGTNSLSGNIPSDLARLSNLKYLDLTINNLTGTVPPAIYNMSSLVYIALASNDLWGEIPHNVGETLPNLLGFNFCFNKFTGSIPGSLFNLTNLQIFRMAHNLLEGTVPPGLQNLPFLEMYNIGYNRLVSSGNDGIDFITLLSNSTRLKFLAIDGNLFRGVIPDSIGKLSKTLQKLYMGGNQLHGYIPSSIGDLTSLALLDLSGNNLSGPIPPEIGRLEELQELVLKRNQLSGSIPGSLGNLQKLNQIDLSGNELVGGIPMDLGSLQSLTSMDLSNNTLNGNVPKEILNIVSMSTILNLSHNTLTGNLPWEIENLKSIVTIDLSNNQLSGIIPSSISNCKSLEKLYMQRNNFSGPIPDALAEVKGLEALDLSYNQLTGSIPSDLQNLQGLELLNLSFNDLEGVVPLGGVFRNLSRTDLAGNPKLCLSFPCSSSRNNRRRLVILFVSVAIMAVVALLFAISSFFYIRRNKAKLSKTTDLMKEQHQMISYVELRRATGNFSRENLIGSGSFGTVYKGSLGDAHDTVAIKVIDNERTGSWKSFLAECEALKNVRHRNLVKLITSCSSVDTKNMKFLALVYEFLQNGSLEDWLRGRRRKANGDGLDLLEKMNVIIDVASVLDYLHNDSEVPVVHCDLKPSNILLDQDFTAKVGDFGLARLLMESSGDNQTSISSTHAIKGSIGYIPPEYGIGVKPSTAGDVFSFGVTLLELFTGKSPVHDSFMGDQNLILWVNSAFNTGSIHQLMGPQVLQQNLYHKEQPIEAEAQVNCLTMVFGVGLSCTVESPDRRLGMRHALHKLVAARNCLLKQNPTENAEN